MKKHEFRELVDQNLSGLVWDEEKRQTVLYAVQKEEKPVKKFTATFVLIAAVICLSVTALAAGLVFSSQVDAFKLAEKAVTDTYGITGAMRSTFFGRTAEETADGGVTVVYSGIEDLRAQRRRTGTAAPSLKRRRRLPKTRRRPLPARAEPAKETGKPAKLKPAPRQRNLPTPRKRCLRWLRTPLPAPIS